MARSYFDHAASSPMLPEAIDAMVAELGLPGNPASLHTSGRRARAVLEDARERLAEDLGCAPIEVVFTSGGTEADNIAVLGAWAARPQGTIGQRNKVVTTQVEHPAVGKTVASLVREGAEVVRVGVDADGGLDRDAYLAALPGAMVASVQWVNNETGTAQDIPVVAADAREADVWSHSDAVQAVGHVPVDFAATGLDLMSVSAHKVGGPVGIGALIARKELPLRPSQFGGGQERDLRSGTQASALAAGFAAAVHHATGRLDAESARLAVLHTRLVDAATAIEGVTVNGRLGSPAIVNLTFDGCRADDLLLMLDLAGVDCSTGSACTAGVHQPSDVLLAMGRTLAAARGSLRFSMGWSTTQADVERLVQALPGAVRQARLANQ